jgi:D-beta-D-heptose 7-phosphate kinase/D-beta-D-heptose 1-phosphate adenosyltransferase
MVSIESKIVAKEFIRAKIDSIKRRPMYKKLGLVHGCFDVITPGHISFLLGARSMCQILVCSVSSDEVVKKNKGDKRPVFNVKERMVHLAALELVDYVVECTASCAAELIQFLAPVILLKGADSVDSVSPDFVLEKETAQKSGGQVCYVVPNQYYHTTDIVAHPQWEEFSVEI